MCEFFVRGVESREWREFRQDKRRQDDTTGVNTTGKKFRGRKEREG